MICPICGNNKTEKVFANFTGYVEGTGFDIFACSRCDTQFIDRQKIDPNIYDVIYAQEKTPGYDRYSYYAGEVKNRKKPLKWLVEQESTYYPIFKEVSSESRKLNILEVGCGYGYVSYSLKKLGHHVVGIDISNSAINYAKSNYGNYFYCRSVENFKYKNNFDLIIATELVEHLLDPVSFIKVCKGLLKKGGKIILTVPNKGYSKKGSVWRTDLPPVHTVWLSKKSFEVLGKQCDLNLDFMDFSKNVSKNENLLFTYIFSRIHQSDIPSPVLSRTGEPYHQRVELADSKIRSLAKKIIYSYPLRSISFVFVRMFTNEYPKLGIVFTKRGSVGR